jgi:hypothetical protein
MICQFFVIAALTALSSCSPNRMTIEISFEGDVADKAIIYMCDKQSEVLGLTKTAFIQRNIECEGLWRVNLYYPHKNIIFCDIGYIAVGIDQNARFFVIEGEKICKRLD